MRPSLNHWFSSLFTIHTLAALLLALPGLAQNPADPQTLPQVTHPAVHSHRPSVRNAPPNPELCASCVQDNLRYLAGPELHGRGSGTEDEHKAAEFVADKLKQYGLAPAAGDGQYIQKATVRSREVVGSPTLTVESKANPNHAPYMLTHGKEVVMAGLSQAPLTARIQKIDLSAGGESAAEIASDCALLIKLKPYTSMEDSRKALEPYRNSKAALIIVFSSNYAPKIFDTLAKQPPQMPELLGGERPKKRAALVLAKGEWFEKLWAEPEGSTVTLQAEITLWKERHTWSVLAKIEGTTEKDQIVLLSAHLDHLGVEDGKTYPGADDDASGTVAVMELARVLAHEPQPQRAVVFALWGSEEAGMTGSRFFLKNPTFPLKQIVANLEFEMIGRPDPKVKPDHLWLTGWDRTDLGPELAKHGAKLVADPHPAERFFMRSDNYPFAEESIVAQTVSSYGLHSDYHQPTDTIDKIDFSHMDNAIASMIEPISWLANTEFKPEWLEGKKP